MVSASSGDDTSTTPAAPRAGKRLMSVEAMRLVMALLVVGLHAKIFWDVSHIAWVAVAEGAARVAVPFFFFLSGYFFAIQVNRGFWNWVLRVGMLYLVWSIIFSALWLRPESSLWLHPESSFQKIIFNVVIGFWHLWYLTALIYGAVVLYFLRRKSTVFLFWLATTCFSIGVALQYTMNFAHYPGETGNRTLAVALVRNFAFVGFPMLCYGYLLNRLVLAQHWLVRSLVDSRSVFLVFAAASAVYALEVYLNAVLFDLDSIRDVYATLPLITGALFLVLGRLPPVAAPLWLSHASAAVYFVHPAILTVLAKIAPAGETAVSIITMLVSLALVPVIIWINRRGLPLL